MKQYTIHVDDITALFFQQVADNAAFPVEKVLEDALFNYAGELATKAIKDAGADIVIDE